MGHSPKGPARLGIYRYDDDLRCAGRALRGPQEEGEYEYAADHHNGENGQEQAHIESAVLYQPLISEADEGAGVEAEHCGRQPEDGCTKDVLGRARPGKLHKERWWKEETGDAFCQAAGAPGLIGAFAKSPIGVFIAVGCAAKGVYELAGGK
jgi:hypothetical protein